MLTSELSPEHRWPSCISCHVTKKSRFFWGAVFIDALLIPFQCASLHRFMSRCVESQTNASWSRSKAACVKSCPRGPSEGVWVFFHALILYNSSSQLLIGDSCVQWSLGAWQGNSPPPVSLHRKALPNTSEAKYRRVAEAGGMRLSCTVDVKIEEEWERREEWEAWRGGLGDTHSDRVALHHARLPALARGQRVHAILSDHPPHSYYFPGPEFDHHMAIRPKDFSVLGLQNERRSN